MSSGEEFEVAEILEQRKRKGVLEYYVRWRGFNNLYDSWEPAASLLDCAKALKAFVTKTKRLRSKSRSKSRGRATKSRSRSSSRGRVTKTDATVKRSRSSGRKTSKTSTKVVVVDKEQEVVNTDKVDGGGDEIKSLSSELIVRSNRLRSRQQAKGETTSISKSEEVVEVVKISSAKEEQVEEQTTQVVKTLVETVTSVPGQLMEATTTTTRSQLVVQEVNNDQKPLAMVEVKEEGRAKWWWWFADHAVLILFIIISLICLSFTIESISGVRDKLVPDLAVLRQRLGESYLHFVQGLSSVYTNMVDAATHAFNSAKEAIFLSGGSTPDAAQAKTKSQ